MRQGRRTVARLPLTPDTMAVRIYPAYGRAYVALMSGAVRVVDASRGTAIRTVRLAPDPFVQFALDASTAHLFVVSTGAVSMLDVWSGMVLRTVRGAGRLFTPLQGIGLWPPSIQIDDRAGLLFIMNHESGTLTTLDTRSGALLHSGYAGRFPVAVAADRPHGRLLVACLGDANVLGEVFGTGTLNVLDVRSGALQRSVPVGVAPVAVAIDATTRRAFVLNRDSDLDFRPARLRADTTPLHRSLAALRRLLPLLAPPMDAPAAGTVTVLDLARL